MRSAPQPAGAIPFVWHTFDVRSELPSNWQEDILKIAREESVNRVLISASVTSREVSEDIRVPVRIVSGAAVVRCLPWLYNMYLGRFRDIAQSLVQEPVSTAMDIRRGINLNVQHGHQHRYECHVDSNPLEGLLYVTDHPPGSGGELVIANNGDVKGEREIACNATRIYPVAGHLIFFDARSHSHYVTRLVDPNIIRVVAAMNFYVPSCTEGDRPEDLDRHLFGVD